ncbi:MAG: hypothetical protein MK085_03980 [Phycisphaerales bacterium]|nr:hypothetical protein [Phycisphaerales bacterium]
MSIDLAVPLLAVSTASRLAARDRDRVAGTLKDDRSPVTVADLAVQVAVTAALRHGNAPLSDRIVGEEGGEPLRGPDGEAMMNEVIELVTTALEETGLAAAAPRNPEAVFECLEAGGLDPEAEGRENFWCLDPIDGTKGFLRGGQFAIALGYVENGQPTLGFLGCPHLPLGTAEDYGVADGTGSVYMGVFEGGSGKAFAGPATAAGLEDLDPIQVSSEPPGGRVRVCLSYEKAHGDQDRTTAALEEAGVQSAPIRIDSQCKYAMVASGRADLYLRLAREGYREKSWDHAAGTAVVRAAGGIAEDMTGRDLAFHGRLLDTTGGICVRTPGVARPILD